jgi:rhomboid protease GluP
MKTKTYIKENFLTKEPTRDGLVPTLYLVSLILFSSFIYLNGYLNAPHWMSASGEDVFNHNEWWRLWTTLFAHGDLTHVLSNLFLFVPFSYYLAGYFGPWFFPLVGFLVGGAINFLVIKTMPAHVSLIGVSGVVYWMGAAWITLSWLVDRRESISKRLIKAGGVSLILFVPDSIKPEVSYLSHFLGYIFGVLSAIAFYQFKKKTFLAAEVVEEFNDEDNYVWGLDSTLDHHYQLHYQEDPYLDYHAYIEQQFDEDPLPRKIH